MPYLSRLGAGLAFLFISVAIAVGACSTRSGPGEALPACPDSAAPPWRLGEAPQPRTVRPALRNHARVAWMLESTYPRDLRDRGIGGTTNVWLHVGEAGTVKDVQVNESSGHGALDRAALRVARAMKFDPAIRTEDDGRCAVPVWIALDVTFTVQR